MEGSAVEIAIDPQGNAWMIDINEDIYKYEKEGKALKQIEGKAKDIAVGGDGKVWIVGTNEEHGGYGIYKLRDNQEGWDRQHRMSALRIAAGEDGTVWCVNKHNDIHLWGRHPHHWHHWCWQHKHQMGKAYDIAVGNDGEIIVLGTEEEPEGYRIKKWKTQWSKLDLEGIEAQKITLDMHSNAYVIDKENDVY